MAPRPDRSDNEGLKKPREDQEEPVLEAARADPTLEADVLGNSYRVSQGNAEVQDTAHAAVVEARERTAPAIGGDPVEDDEEDDDGNVAAAPRVAVQLFGDDDWLPPAQPMPPPPDLEAFMSGDPIDEAVLCARRDQVRPIATFAVEETLEYQLCPRGDLVEDYLSDWADSAGQWVGSHPLQLVLAWLAKSGGRRLDAPNRPHMRLSARRAALGTLALASAQPASGFPTDLLIMAVGLSARRSLPDTLTRLLLAGPPTLHRASQILSRLLPDAPHQHFETNEPAPTSDALYWSRVLGLRPATHWSPPALPALDDTDPLARLMGATVDSVDAEFSEACARLGMGLFSEVMRLRIRTAAAMTLIARSCPVRHQRAARTAGLHIADVTDRSTHETLTALRALGSGIHRHGWAASQAHAQLDHAVATYARTVQALPVAVAQLAWQAAGNRRYVTTPTAKSEMLGWLERGNLHAARQCIGPPQDIQAVLAAAILDAQDDVDATPWRALVDLQPRLARAGRQDLATIVDVLTGPAALRDGASAEAHAIGERVRARGIMRHHPALIVDGTCLILDASHALGVNQAESERLIIHTASHLLALHCPVWSDTMLRYTPPT